MFRPAIACMFILMAAAPASAQPFITRACQPLANGDVRCALRVELGHESYDVMINAVKRGSEARMQADTYVSTCGSPGRMVGRTNIANSGTSRVTNFVYSPNAVEFAAQLTIGSCVEVFLVNCTEAGQRKPCRDVLDVFPSRIELYRQ